MSASGTDRLVGVRAKIERAKKHVGELQIALGAFYQTNPYVVRPEDDANTGDLIYRLCAAASIPIEIPIIVGDVLHNLRSAMDHLVWQLVEANGNAPRERATCFPVGESPEKHESRADRSAKGVCEEAMNLIADAKPYKGGDDDLWHVHELNNIDKHRLLLPAATYNQSLDIPTQGGLIALPSTIPLLFEEGKVLLRITAAARAGGISEQMGGHPQFSFHVALAEPDDIRREPLVPTLIRLCRAVDGLVGRFAHLL